MEAKSETNLSRRQQIVLEWFSNEPYKPENLWKKLKDKKLQITLSRPTFYRAFKVLKEVNLIYHLTEEDKQKYGIVEQGNFYFRSDPKRKKRWGKLVEKVKDFTGTQNIGLIISIMKRDFGNFPLVTNDDLSSILDTITKMTEDSLWSLRGDLLSFLENHVKRMFYRTNNSDYNLQRKTQDLFKRLLTTLHNGPGNNVEQVIRSFRLSSYVNGEEWGMTTVRDVINKGCKELQSNTLNISQLAPKLIGEFVTLFGANNILPEIEGKIETLWEEGLDRNFNDSKEGTCQYFLSEALKEFVKATSKI